MRRKLLGIHHTTLERLVVPELVHVGQHKAIPRFVHDVVLAAVLVKRSDNVVGHQGQTSHGLAVDGHAERLKLRRVGKLFMATFSGQPHNHGFWVRKEPSQLKVPRRSIVLRFKFWRAGEVHRP